MGGKQSGKAEETDSTVSWNTFLQVDNKHVLVGKRSEKSTDRKCQDKNMLWKERREEGDSKKEQSLK